MKLSYLILSVMMLTGYNCYAQNTPWSTSGPIGIGTNSPRYQLDVQQAGTGISGAIVGIQGFVNASGAGAYLRLIKSRGATTGTFATTLAGDALGAVDYMGVNINSAVGYAARIVGYQDGTAGAAYIPGKLSFFTGSSTANGLVERMTITSSGNIGIGISTPQTNLDVTGTVAMGGNNSNLDNRNGTIPLNFLANTGKVLVGWNRTQGAGETDFISNQGNGNVGGFAFYNHANNNAENQLMWLTGDGKLLLGVTTGNTGNNKLAVGGGIIAESVTIKLQPNWPDYVFKKDYRLPSLQEVKAYIDQNQHLPEIPSAQEVAKNGLNLGEMNKLLVKKMEELTLYLIEKDKEVNEQKADIDKLKEQVQLLLIKTGKKN